MAKVKKPAGYADYPGGYKDKGLTPSEARAYTKAEKKLISDHAEYLRKLERAGFWEEAADKRYAGVGVWEREDSVRAADRLKKALADSTQTARAKGIYNKIDAEKMLPRPKTTPKKKGK